MFRTENHLPCPCHRSRKMQDEGVWFALFTVPAQVENEGCSSSFEFPVAVTKSIGRLCPVHTQV